jgi:hypothetical protein
MIRTDSAAAPRENHVTICELNSVYSKKNTTSVLIPDTDWASALNTKPLTVY